MRHASSTQQLAVYETTVQAHPVLTREREQELFRRVSDGDLDARRTILLSNVRLVVKVCYRFLRDGMPLEDLVQEGLIGLMTAVEKFEVERGHKFSTYATWWIRQAAWKAAWELRHIVHVPIDNSTKLNRVGRAWEALARESGSGSRRRADGDTDGRPFRGRSDDRVVHGPVRPGREELHARRASRASPGSHDP